MRLLDSVKQHILPRLPPWILPWASQALKTAGIDLGNAGLGQPPSGPDAPAQVLCYKGYAIPLPLLPFTGGGPEAFMAISAAHLDSLDRVVGIRPDDQLLEIGWGVGLDAIPLTERLSARGSYLGVDISKAAIAWCRSAITSKHKNFRFHHWNVKDKLHNPNGTLSLGEVAVPVADGTIDLIILQSVFPHLLADDVVACLKLCRRLLKPTGQVYAALLLYDDAVLESARRTNLTPFHLRFEHELHPGCRVKSLDCVTGGVAYTKELFDELLARAGMRLARPYLRGAWSGYFKDAEDGQDTAVLMTAA